MIKLKRIYDAAAPGDGFRILVDLLWPRNMSKERAKVDLWVKKLAPSENLRRWYAHETGKWLQFQRLYKEELSAHREQIKDLARIITLHNVVTFLFAAQDSEHNSAVVLRDVIRHLKK